jgi:hypothetical protein
MVAKHNEKPKNFHYSVVKMILWYLERFIDHGLFCYRMKTYIVLHGFWCAPKLFDKLKCEYEVKTTEE